MADTSSSKKKQALKTDKKHVQAKQTFLHSSTSESELSKLKESSVMKPSSYMYTISCEKDNVCSANISPKNNFLACGLENSDIYLWNLKPITKTTKANTDKSENLNERLSSEMDDENYLIGHNNVLEGHQGSVYGLAFSLPHSLLLTCSEDSSVRAWNLEDFRTVAVYSDQNYPTWDLTLSNNGSYFATASMDFCARLWCFERSQPLRIYAGHSSSVGCVRFHSNSRYLATTSDKLLQLWTTADSRTVRGFTGHKSPISCIAFSPDGQHLASADDIGCIKIWDLGSGKQINQIKAHSDRILSIAYSKNSNFIASGGFDMILKVWDVKQCSDVKIDSPTSIAESSTNGDFYSSEHFDGHSTGSIIKFVSFRNKDLLVSVAT